MIGKVFERGFFIGAGAISAGTYAAVVQRFSHSNIDCLVRSKKTALLRMIKIYIISILLNNHLLKQVGSNNGLKVRIRVD